MHFLLSEFWHSHIYAQPFFDRLSELGHRVSRFEERRFFDSHGFFGELSARAQNRFRLGPGVSRLNSHLLRAVVEERPDVLFLFRGTHVWAETLEDIRKRGVYIIGWNNDDPFSEQYPRYFWRHFRQSIPLYDHLFAYRSHNVDDFRAAGCKRVDLLRSFYLRELNHPVDPRDSRPYQCDVSFTGHWEADGRERYLEALLSEERLELRLWGTLWERSAIWPALRRRFATVRPVLKREYNLALNGSKICLVFLSHLNRDTYARRSFEIPAAGSMMLSEYTDDLASLYVEGKEIEFFRSPRELLEKARFYAREDEARRRIAAAGRARLLRDGHEALDRSRQVADAVAFDLSGASYAPHATKGAHPS
jgi:spore maturation protein CgeB